MRQVDYLAELCGIAVVSQRSAVGIRIIYMGRSGRILYCKLTCDYPHTQLYCVVLLSDFGYVCSLMM